MSRVSLWFKALALLLLLSGPTAALEVFTDGAPATTNLVTNPSLEVDTTGWTLYAASTIARITTDGLYGTASLQMTATGANARAYYAAGSLSASTVYTASAWVKRNSGSGLPILNVRGAIANVETGNNGTTAIGASHGNWQRLVNTYTLSGTENSVRVIVGFNASSVNTDQLTIDGVQLEQALRPTTYLDGTLGTGYAWTGTAHASTSTRALGALPSPNVWLPQGLSGQLRMPN